MLKAIIIDDERDARYLLQKQLLKDFAYEIEVVGEAAGCSEGVTLIEAVNPDIVFLDIQLSDGTGFELLEKLSDTSFNLVFVTAYDRFAIKAFEFSAIGYLVKPLNAGELKKTIDRIREHAAQHRKATMGIKVLIENFNAGKIKKIVVPSADGFNVVQLEQISYINSIRNYSEFHLTDGTKIMTSKSLIIYDKLLADHGFFRIHQTYLVNLSHVQAYIRADGGGLKMDTGELLPVARQKKAGLMERFL